MRDLLNDVSKRKDSSSAVDEYTYFKLFIEDLKCCGNCGNISSCNTKRTLCKEWVFDNKTKEDRLK